MRSLFPAISLFCLFLLPGAAGAVGGVRGGDAETQGRFEEIVRECGRAVTAGETFGAKEGENPFVICVAQKGIHKLGMPEEERGTPANILTDSFAGGTADEAPLSLPADSSAVQETGTSPELKEQAPSAQPRYYIQSDDEGKGKKPVFLNR